MAANETVKSGFMLGIGLALALLVIGFVQVLILKAVKRG